MDRRERRPGRLLPVYQLLGPAPGLRSAQRPVRPHGSASAGGKLAGQRGDPRPPGHRRLVHRVPPLSPGPAQSHAEHAGRHPGYPRSESHGDRVRHGDPLHRPPRGAGAGRPGRPGRHGGHRLGRSRRGHGRARHLRGSRLCRRMHTPGPADHQVAGDYAARILLWRPAVQCGFQRHADRPDWRRSTGIL